MDKEEFKRRFDGSHDRGTLTSFGAGANLQNQKITLFLETTIADGTNRVECQMTLDQATEVAEDLIACIDHLSGRHN